MKNTYEKLFDEFLDLTEFRLLKHKDGTFSLEDQQCANLGDIEDDRFTSASEILDRMDIYIQDYIESMTFSLIKYINSKLKIQKLSKMLAL